MKETKEELKLRAGKIISRLKKAYPKASTALLHTSAIELLVSTILSAQCTDERVNKVTIELFKKYSKINHYANANQSELEHYIKSTGFYRAKAKNIINCCKALIEKHGGTVPDNMEDLIQLPGVGRKTANVILGNFFGKIEGIVVDTHVKRLSGRLGFSKEVDPEKIEQDLMEIIPKKDWILIGNLLIFHGRSTCQARKPKCSVCQVNQWCPSKIY
ncbi:MAG: endonuclease III [Bacteroidota bacterium]|nr:endonuclease III [Bacteroidota bacterium]